MALVACAAVPLAFAACGGTEAPPPAANACGDPTQVSLPACAGAGEDPFSDEACIPLDDSVRAGRVTVDDARAPAITAPAEGQVVPGATPFAFAWTAPTALRRAPTPADEWRRLVTLVPEAEAHCAPFTGRAYELAFRAGATVLLRRQPSRTGWTPDEATWCMARQAECLAACPLIVADAGGDAATDASGDGSMDAGDAAARDPVCQLIGSRCHAYDDHDGGVGNQCHELGHANNASVCAMRQA